MGQAGLGAPGASLVPPPAAMTRPALLLAALSLAAAQSSDPCSPSPCGTGARCEVQVSSHWWP